MPLQWKFRLTGQAELWDNKLDKALYEILFLSF